MNFIKFSFSIFCAIFYDWKIRFINFRKCMAVHLSLHRNNPLLLYTLRCMIEGFFIWDVGLIYEIHVIGFFFANLATALRIKIVRAFGLKRVRLKRGEIWKLRATVCRPSFWNLKRCPRKHGCTSKSSSKHRYWIDLYTLTGQTLGGYTKAIYREIWTMCYLIWVPQPSSEIY